MLILKGWVDEGELANSAEKEPTEKNQQTDLSKGKEIMVGYTESATAEVQVKMRETRPFIMLGIRRPLLTLVSTGRVKQRTEMMLQLMEKERVV